MKFSRNKKKEIKKMNSLKKHKLCDNNKKYKESKNKWFFNQAFPMKNTSTQYSHAEFKELSAIIGSFLR